MSVVVTELVSLVELDPLLGEASQLVCEIGRLVVARCALVALVEAPVLVVLVVELVAAGVLVVVELGAVVLTECGE